MARIGRNGASFKKYFLFFILFYSAQPYGFFSHNASLLLFSLISCSLRSLSRSLTPSLSLSLRLFSLSF